MNISAILREIDAELERLQTIRDIVSRLSPAAPRSTRRARIVTPDLPEESALVTMPTQQPEPRLLIVPAKAKREYGPRIKTVATEPKALAAPVSDRPVFVPKSQETKSAPKTPPPSVMDADALEAALRRNLLGGAA